MSEFINREQAENDLLACAAYIAERIKSADGHASSVSEVALRYAAKGELDLAAGLADSIEDPHTRDLTLSEIAARCADFNDDEYGLQLAQAIEDWGFQQQAQHALAIAQARNQRFEEALATAQTLDEPNSTLTEIAVLLAQQGEEAKARELLDQIDLSVPRVQILSELALAKIKQTQSPDIILEEALEEIEHLEFVEEQTHLLLEVAALFIDIKKNERAFAVLEEAQSIALKLERRFRDQVLAQISFLYVRSGDLNRAEAVLKLIVDAHQTADALVSIAVEHFNKDESEIALSNLEEAYAVLRSQPAREVRDSVAKFNLLSLIAVRFAQFNKFERAFSVALENPDEDLRARTLNEIAVNCAIQNNLSLALQAATAIDNPAVRTFALINIASSERKLNNLDQAKQILQEAHSLSEEIHQLPLRSEILNKLAENYLALEDKITADQCLQESLHVASAIFDQSQQAIVLANSAEFFEKLKLDLTESNRETLNLIARKRT